MSHQISDSEIAKELRTLNDSMRVMETVVADNNVRRINIVNKLEEAIGRIDLANTNGMTTGQLEHAGRLLGEFRQYMKDIDSTTQKEVAIKMSRREQDINVAMSFSAADFLSKIPIGGSPMAITQSGSRGPTKEEINSMLENQFVESGLIILPTELENDEHMLPRKEPTDPGEEG